VTCMAGPATSSRSHSVGGYAITEDASGSCCAAAGSIHITCQPWPRVRSLSAPKIIVVKARVLDMTRIGETETLKLRFGES